MNLEEWKQAVRISRCMPRVWYCLLAPEQTHSHPGGERLNAFAVHQSPAAGHFFRHASNDCLIVSHDVLTDLEHGFL